MSDYGQPDIAGTWDFQINDIEINEIGPPGQLVVPHRIVNVPNQFQLTVKIHNEGFASSMIHGKLGTIEFQARECVSNTMTTLPSSSFTVQTTLDFDVTSGVFTTGPGNDLDAGTYELTCLASMDNAPESGICSAFNQTMMKVI